MLGQCLFPRVPGQSECLRLYAGMKKVYPRLRGPGCRPSVCRSRRGSIPFKKNSVPHLPMDDGDEVWNRLLAFFMFNRAEFKKHYHKRSNVESTIGAIKAKMGEPLRCKNGTAMVNEVLVKVLCYNITVLISAMFELGIEPVFTGGDASDQQPPLTPRIAWG